MISTEAGHEEWLEERRVALKSIKKLYHKFQLSERKKNMSSYVTVKMTGNISMKY